MGGVDRVRMAPRHPLAWRRRVLPTEGDADRAWRPDQRIDRLPEPDHALAVSIVPSMIFETGLVQAGTAGQDHAHPFSPPLEREAAKIASHTKDRQAWTLQHADRPQAGDPASRSGRDDLGVDNRRAALDGLAGMGNNLRGAAAEPGIARRKAAPIARNCGARFISLSYQIFAKSRQRT